MGETLKAQKKEQDWILIFYFSWYLDETNSDAIFENIHKEIWDFTNKKVIFNFSWLTYLNSKSLWYISEIWVYLDESNGKFYITNCSDWIKNILSLIWIEKILNIVLTEEEAIKLIK